jgi:multicomponent Na+:H+ antiporter subunit F
VNPFLLLSGVLLVVLVGPGLLLVGRGGATARLVGLQLASAVTVLLLTVLSVAMGQPSLLIVPLVTVLLSFAGTLVFTRLVRGER